MNRRHGVVLVLMVAIIAVLFVGCDDLFAPQDDQGDGSSEELGDTDNSTDQNDNGEDSSSPNEGSLGSPVRLTLDTSHAGKIGATDTAYEDSYYSFTTGAAGSYSVVVTDVRPSGSDIDFSLQLPDSTSSVTSDYGSDSDGIADMSLDGSTTYYLNVMNIVETEAITYTITIQSPSGGGDSPSQDGTGSVEDPVFSLDAGSYPATTTLSLSSNSGSTIYYTIDGTDPDSNSTLFEGNIDLVEDVTIKAVAIAGTVTSNIVEREYTITARYPDFTLSLRTGSTWSFHWYWNHYVNYSYTDQPFTVENDFTITLGEPHVIDGISFYQLDCEYTSGSLSGDDAGDKIQWKYLAYLEDKKQLLASDDGDSFTVIFDAMYGFWHGKGFFSEFDEDQPLTVSNSDDEFIMSEGWSWSDNDTVYYPGTGTIYDPDPYSSYSRSTEKYKSGIGPYYWTSSGGSSHSYSSSGDTYKMTLNWFEE